MQIKTRLSLYFTIASAILLLLLLLAINALFDRYTEKDFFSTLRERAVIAASVYLEADEISSSSLKHFKSEYLNTLHNEVIRMYDSNGNAAFIDDDDHYWKKDIIDKVRAKKSLQYKHKDTSVVGIRYDDNQGSFVILVSAIDKQGNERRLYLLQITIIMYFIQLLILFFTGRWFARKALGSVKKINEQVQRINATDLHMRVDEGIGRDEISELAVNFNSLLQRLETSFKMQKTFVTNASHELRTPLTSIIGEIEVTLSQPRDTAEYKKVLSSVLTEAENLHHVMEGLFSLAIAESKITWDKSEPVRVDELLWDLQAFFAKMNPPQILNVQMLHLPEDENELYFTANKGLLLLAISNVIRNAFKFSYNQPVYCGLTYSPQELAITVADQGIGMTKEEIGNIFKPFYRSSSAGNFEGVGVGMFIAGKIVELYHGVIDIHSIPGQGTTVNIIFAKK